MPAGRPEVYTPELADRICAGIAEGVSLRSVCKGDDFPALSTVFLWFRTKPDFSEQYAKAKEASADYLAEEILDICDDGTNDWVEKFGREGENIGWQFNGEAVARSRLRVDSRKWIASKLKPKKYGDKIDTTVSGVIDHTHTVNETDREIINRFLEGKK